MLINTCPLSLIYHTVPWNISYSPLMHSWMLAKSHCSQRGSHQDEITVKPSSPASKRRIQEERSGSNSQTRDTSNLSLSPPALKFRCIQQESTGMTSRSDHSPVYFSTEPVEFSAHLPLLKGFLFQVQFQSPPL